ncbi:hypothetical protein DFH07DRAFT_780449 [Mycena maculata]|uniref:Uncharacterized protein n=1 Tax=Mycena maculata TaxID=230809 RepID=A0AAD7MVL8_9AGAR|nr:hypothetical protein DFH07DRAFT_780449 [Mycena maculata]
MSLSKEKLCSTLKEQSATTPFGPGKRLELKLAHFRQCVGDNFEKLEICPALEALDGLLSSFNIQTNSVGSYQETEAHKKHSVDKLRHISRDRSWLDNVLQAQASQWGDLKVSNLLIPWEYTIANSMGLRRGVLQKVCEAAVDQFAVKDGDISNIAVHNLSVGPETILIKQQQPTYVPSSGNVHPDVNFYALKKENKQLFEHWENKTLEVMVYHASDLEEISESWLENVTKRAVREMVIQAYTSSTSTTKVCKVVWMGHSCLSYVHGRTLFVSNWRSAQPERMKNLLSLYKPWTAPIVQAHFIRETLALANIDPTNIQDFVRKQQKTTISSIITNLIQVLMDPFDILSRIFQPSLVLGDIVVHGHPCWLRGTPDLGKALAIQPPWHPKAPWFNLHGIPKLLGSTEINTAPNRGQWVIFMTNCGEPVGDEELEEGGVVRIQLYRILRRLHRHGFHHHDLQDFGHAIAAMDCKLGDDCPDLLFLQEVQAQDVVDVPDVPDLVPSLPQSSEDSQVAPSKSEVSHSPPQAWFMTPKPCLHNRSTFFSVGNVRGPHQSSICVMKPGMAWDLVAGMCPVQDGCGANLWNTGVYDFSIKAKEACFEVVCNGLSKEEYQTIKANMSEDEKKHLLKQLASKCKVEFKGIHVTNKSPAMDAMQTANSINDQLINLFESMGIHTFAMFTRSHAEDSVVLNIVDSDNTHEFLSRLLGSPFPSSYSSLSNDLVHWTKPSKIAFASPIKLSADEAHQIHDSLRSGAIHWVALTPSQSEEVAKEISEGLVRK